jgi:signal transduction histidine kinase
MNGIAHYGALGPVAALDRAASPGQSHALLSLAPAGRRERRIALGVVVASTVAFLAAAPFAKLQLTPVPAFLPAYQAALILNELITALLLFGQFHILRSQALLLLAGAYLFSALMAVSHALSFPGLFLPAGLLGAGPQTTAWIYFLWHAGFPLLVILYAVWPAAAMQSGDARRLILGCIAASFALAGGLTLFTTAGHELLPAIMAGNRDAPAKVVVATASWLLCLAALPLLWRRRPHSILDLWLMVVVSVWAFDVALAAVLNAGRFDLGWYAGRVYGLLAGSFVLAVLLLEHGKLYARLASVHAETARALARHAERLRILGEIDQAMLAEKPTDAIAASVIQPLRELLGVPRAIVNRFDLAAGEVEWIAAAGRRRIHVGPGVRYSIVMMGDLEALKRGEPQVIDARHLPPGREVEALLASGVEVYMVVPMIAGGELLGAISFGGQDAAFPAEHAGIAREVAAQLAIVLRQAELLERVRGHAAELGAQVRARTAELEATNKELEAFSYSVSHDLRAPLRAVDGYARMLEEDCGAALDAEGRRLLSVVRDAAGRMGRLIDDLLAFSRLGRQAPVRRRVDMDALVAEVFAELRGESRAVLAAAALPAADADPAMLRQVWANLIGNALKYSGKRADPRIEVSARVDGAEAVYSVRDNGVGFDPRYADKLFGVFQRLHRADEFPGTGVGLAIVQRVVARHGGRVWAEGAPGQGACFHFSLPRGSA